MFLPGRCPSNGWPWSVSITGSLLIRVMFGVMVSLKNGQKGYVLWITQTKLFPYHETLHGLAFLVLSLSTLTWKTRQRIAMVTL